MLNDSEIDPPSGQKKKRTHMRLEPMSVKSPELRYHCLLEKPSQTVEQHHGCIRFPRTMVHRQATCWLQTYTAELEDNAVKSYVARDNIST